MSDSGIEPVAPADFAAPGGVPASPALETGAPPPVSDDDFPEVPTDQAVFDATYVRSLREKGAGYRTAARDATERLAAYSVFDQYEPEDRQVFIDMADAWRRNPAEAAAMMQQIVEAVLPASQDSQPGQRTAASTPPEGAAPLFDDDGEVTPETVKALVQGELASFAAAQAEQDRQLRLDREVEGIHAEMRAAGFEPASREGRYLLQIAASETGGDLPKAIAEFRGWQQSIVDGYVSGKANGAGGVVPVTTGTPGIEAPTEPKTFKEAAEQARLYVASLNQNQ